MSKTLTITETKRPRTEGSGGGAASVDAARLTRLEAAVAALQELWQLDDQGNIVTPYNVVSQGNITAFTPPATQED